MTAEQLVREANATQLEAGAKVPTQKIVDREELAEHQLQKRKHFEDYVRRNGAWLDSSYVKYAAWEETQGDYARARSVFERALEAGHNSKTLWIKYAEMEMRGKFVNHARNVWDRACTLFPRIDQYWCDPPPPPRAPKPPPPPPHLPHRQLRTPMCMARQPVHLLSSPIGWGATGTGDNVLSRGAAFFCVPGEIYRPGHSHVLAVASARHLRRDVG